MPSLWRDPLPTCCPARIAGDDPRLRRGHRDFGCRRERPSHARGRDADRLIHVTDRVRRQHPLGCPVCHQARQSVLPGCEMVIAAAANAGPASSRAGAAWWSGVACVSGGGARVALRAASERAGPILSATFWRGFDCDSFSQIPEAVPADPVGYLAGPSAFLTRVFSRGLCAAGVCSRPRKMGGRGCHITFTKTLHFRVERALRPSREGALVPCRFHQETPQ
jgi:hypothetical protein